MLISYKNKNKNILHIALQKKAVLLITCLAQVNFGKNEVTHLPVFPRENTTVIDELAIKIRSQCHLYLPMINDL